jgi:hypothetical protein
LRCKSTSNPLGGTRSETAHRYCVTRYPTGPCRNVGRLEACVLLSARSRARPSAHHENDVELTVFNLTSRFWRQCFHEGLPTCADVALSAAMKPPATGEAHDYTFCRAAFVIRSNSMLGRNELFHNRNEKYGCSAKEDCRADGAFQKNGRVSLSKDQALSEVLLQKAAQQEGQ